MSVMLKALILCMIIVSVESARKAMTPTQANFFAVHNGYFDNKVQAQKKGSMHDFIQMRSIPLQLEVFPGRTVLFYEWSINGRVDYLVIIDVTDNYDGSVSLQLYEFTDITKLKALEYDIADLDDLPKSDFMKIEDCVPMYEITGPGELKGKWPDCTRYVNGKRVFYRETFTCTSHTVFVPDGSVERNDSPLPYMLVPSGKKYPIPGAPPGFVNPCNATSKPYY